MVGYIEICEINGLGQGVSLYFFGKEKRNMWLHVSYPTNVTTFCNIANIKCIDMWPCPKISLLKEPDRNTFKM